MCKGKKKTQAGAKRTGIYVHDILRPFLSHTFYHGAKGNGNGCHEETEITALKQGPYGRDLEWAAI